MIPVEAVVETEQGIFCWVGTREEAQRRSLQLGNSNDVYIVVEAGLQEGDQVVLNPTACIPEAQRLSPAPSHSRKSQSPDNLVGESERLEKTRPEASP